MRNDILTSLSILAIIAGVKASSSYSIELYSDSNCQDLIATDGGTFTSNGCVSQAGVNSIRITSLDNAMIHTWAHSNCNHNEWKVPVDCPGGDSCIKAPGTNSFGFQVGCI